MTGSQSSQAPPCMSFAHRIASFCHPYVTHNNKKIVMANVTLSQAVKLTGKSKRTIQRYMASGKVSFRTNDKGHKEIDTAELVRVFGELSHPVTPDVRPAVTVTEDDRINKLISVVEMQQKQITELTESVRQFTNLLEHKKEKAEEIKKEKGQRPASNQTNLPDYLADMEFISR